MKNKKSRKPLSLPETADQVQMNDRQARKVSPEEAIQATSNPATNGMLSGPTGDEIAEYQQYMAGQ